MGLEATLNSEKEAWWKYTSTNQDFEIEMGTSEVEKLETQFGEEAAAIGPRREQIEQLAADIANEDQNQKAARKAHEAEALEAPIKAQASGIEDASTPTAFVQHQRSEDMNVGTATTTTATTTSTTATTKPTGTEMARTPTNSVTSECRYSV